MITDLFGFISIISLNIFHLICFSLRYSSPTFLPSIELLKFTLYLFFSSTGLEVYILVTIFLKFLTNTHSFIFFFSKIYLLTWERDTDRQTDRHWFVVPLTYAIIGWFLYVPLTGNRNCNLMYQDDALTELPGQGSVLYFSNEV